MWVSGRRSGCRGRPICLWRVHLCLPRIWVCAWRSSAARAAAGGAGPGGSVHSSWRRGSLCVGRGARTRSGALSPPHQPRWGLPRSSGRGRQCSSVRTGAGCAPRARAPRRARSVWRRSAAWATAAGVRAAPGTFRLGSRTFYSSGRGSVLWSLAGCRRKGICRSLRNYRQYL